MDVRIRQAEGAEPQPYLFWDSIWDQANIYADWAIGPASDPLNPKGLQSYHGLDTAIVLSLFTWKRADEGEIQYMDDSNPRGWWGDAVDLDTNETALGSKLWLLYRRELTDAVRKKAEDYAQEALLPLIKQGAVVRFDVAAEIDKLTSRLSLRVQAFSQDGNKVYDQRFDRIWAQERR